MAKVGRKKRVIDLQIVKNLAAIQCNIKEIASVLEIPMTTLQSRPDFRSVYESGKETGKATLRRTQFRLAETSAAMAIFLGKQYLGQVDIPFEIKGLETKIIIVRANESSIKDVSGQVHLQQVSVPGDVLGVGNRQEYVADISSNVIQRADTR